MAPNHVAEDALVVLREVLHLDESAAAFGVGEPMISRTAASNRGSVASTGGVKASPKAKEPPLTVNTVVGGACPYSNCATASRPRAST